jgi:protein-disulfide isomerase
MKWTLPAATAALVLAGGGWWALQQRAGNAEPEMTRIAQVDTGGTATDAVPADGPEVVEMTLGAEDAPVEVIEYASYTCPHCATFHQSVFKDLREEYIDTGQVRFTYREVYFDKYGMWASLIARCEPSRFFGVTDLIYKGQQEWARAGSDAAIAEDLRRIGRMAGLDSDQVEACLTDGEKLQSLVAWYQRNAEEHDISSTPSFVIDGQKYGNMSYADFAAAIDERLPQ